MQGSLYLCLFFELFYQSKVLIKDLNKTLIYFLLFLFLFNSTGYYFIFELHKHRVKKEIQARINKESLVLTVLKISDAEHDPLFQRVEEKEIRYKGSLYDVIKEINTDRVTIFYCIHDKKEENLMAAMKTVNKSMFLLSLWDHVIKIAIPPSDNSMTDRSPLTLVFPQISFPLPSFFIGTWSPPPELS
jgi:hypothetical protein